VLAHALGINSYLRLDTYILKIANGPGLFMAFPCAGLDIMSFWIAFVNADNKNTWQKKVYWCVVGVSIIWLINCFRVTLLLFALQNRWELVTGVDQHTTFNIVAYSFICLLVYFYNKSYEKKIFVVNL
jgi:exosortase/archaeosortase family protein